MDYDCNTFTFVCALPFDVNEEPKLEVGDGINGVVDGNTKRNPTKCNYMHLQLHATNCHLQLALIVFATILHP